MFAISTVLLGGTSGSLGKIFFDARMLNHRVRLLMIVLNALRLVTYTSKGSDKQPLPSMHNSV